MKLVNFVLALIIAYLQYQLWFGESGLLDGARLSEQIDKQNIINSKMQKKNRLLSDEIADLREGSEVLEGLARSRLGMIKENEIFVLIIDG
ncbi:MAG: septum formation initiator family protein [bacterium]